MVKGRLKIGNGSRKSSKKDLRTFFFFFFFFFFLCFSLLKTTEICFGSTKMGNFLPGKRISRREKKSGKITLPTQKNMPVTPLDRPIEFKF